MAGPLRVVQIGFFNDPRGRSPGELLEAWPTLVDLAEAASRGGVHVSVAQACAHAQQLMRNGLRYDFLAFGAAFPAARSSAALRELLDRLAPDVLHVHGLDFPRQVRSLAAIAPGVPILLQDHASKLPRPWRRPSWRRGVSAAAGVSFCALEQARPFVQAGIIGPNTLLYEVPESTSRFTPGSHEEARRVTHLEGDPAILWVGHLDANKDPLTVLEGVSAATRALPGLKLHCCYAGAPLLEEVKRRIAADPALVGRVRLLGRVPHGEIELLMRAADLFVLASHREGSGYALLEALACGLPPVVTDIPSFRALTEDGAVGALFPCGDSRALGAALVELAARLGPALRAQVRAHFERELSLEALGGKLARMYHDLLEHRGGAAPAARYGAGTAASRAS